MSSFIYNLILLKLDSKNMGILLNILKRWVFYYIVLKFRVFTYFARIRLI